MAYEPSEADIMKRPPRDPKKDRIINGRMLAQAYGQIGWIQCMAGFMCYFVVFAENGWWPGDIFSPSITSGSGIWESKVDMDMQDSFGQEWVCE